MLVKYYNVARWIIKLGSLTSSHTEGLKLKRRAVFVTEHIPQEPRLRKKIGSFS